MWYEGHILRFEEPSEELEDFFAANEFIKPDFSGIDQHMDMQQAAENEDYIMDNTEMPYIPVPLNIPHKDIFEEANHLLYTACYTAHRPASSGWLSLAIHGISSVHTNCAEDYGLPDDYEETHSDWTDIAKFCPRTVEWMKDEMHYDNFARVRFMAVLPGGWLAPHRDRDRIRGVGATNVAINTPDGCAMVMGGWGVAPQAPGTAIKLNTGYEHAVWNRSDEPRIHMIFDGDPSSKFKRLVNSSYSDITGQ